MTTGPETGPVLASQVMEDPETIPVATTDVSDPAWVAKRSNYDPWRLLPPSEQDRLLELARQRHPAIARFPNLLAGVALEILRERRPELFPALEEPASLPPAPRPGELSQGNPRRSLTRSEPSVLSPLPGIRLHAPASGSLAEVLLSEIRRDLHNPIPFNMDRDMLFAERLCELLRDPDSELLYRRRLRELRDGSLTWDCFYFAVLHALTPGRVERGRKFSAFVSRHREAFASLSIRKTTAGGLLGKDSPPAVASNNSTPVRRRR
jgi:hypothetical protein